MKLLTVTEEFGRTIRQLLEALDAVRDGIAEYEDERDHIAAAATYSLQGRINREIVDRVRAGRATLDIVKRKE